MLAIVPALTMCTVLGESHRLMSVILGRNFNENNNQNENRKTGACSSPVPLGMIFLVTFRSLCLIRMILGLFHPVMEERAQGSRQRPMENMGLTKVSRLHAAFSSPGPSSGGRGWLPDV